MEESDDDDDAAAGTGTPRTTDDGAMKGLAVNVLDVRVDSAAPGPGAVRRDVSAGECSDPLSRLAAAAAAAFLDRCAGTCVGA